MKFPNLKSITYSLLLTISISCSDNNEVPYYSHQWTIDLSVPLQKTFSGNGAYFLSLELEEKILLAVYTADGQNQLVEIDFKGNYLSHTEIDDFYISHMRKRKDGTVLIGMVEITFTDSGQAEYTYVVSSYQNKNIQIINSYSLNTLNISIPLGIELTHDGILVYERNLASKDPTFIAHYNFSGQLDWKTILDESGNKRIAYTTEVYDEYFYAAGGSLYPLIGWKIDLNSGEVIWEKYFQNYYQINFICENNIKETFISNTTPNSYQNVIEKYSFIDNSALLQSTWKLNLDSRLINSNNISFTNNPTPTIDNGVIVVLNEQIGAEYTAHLAKISNAGTVQWQKSFKTGPPQGIGILELKNENIIVSTLYGIVSMYSR